MIPKLDATPLDERALRDHLPIVLAKFREYGVNAKRGVRVEAEGSCQQLVDVGSLE